MGQTLYRYGSGFPVVTIKDVKTPEELRKWAREWGPLTARTSMFKTDRQEIEFKGLAGRALNPRPYYSAIISDCQSRYEPAVMDLINRLIETEQIMDTPYTINWLGGFEINPRDKAAAELDRIRGLQIMTNWMTVNEIRDLENLERVPRGDVVLGLTKLQSVTAVPNANSATSKRKLEPKRKWGKPVDKLLADKIASGESVNNICKKLGISTQTFYRWDEEYELKM